MIMDDITNNDNDRRYLEAPSSQVYNVTPGYQRMTIVEVMLQDEHAWRIVVPRIFILYLC